MDIERHQLIYVYAPEPFENAVQVVQYLYNLPESTSNEVLEDLYAFYSNLARSGVDQRLIKYVNQHDINIMTKLEEIARKHGAVSSLEISLDRAHAKTLLQKANK